MQATSGLKVVLLDAETATIDRHADCRIRLVYFWGKGSTVHTYCEHGKKMRTLSGRGAEKRAAVEQRILAQGLHTVRIETDWVWKEDGDGTEATGRARSVGADVT